ncbi:uncharacterized protein At2g33490-like isoform X2 [Cornus florida]|uniref:uncharacterized protein At2g33490-like isoform X2 n=1 Tax=Cornus florida TaxID=4283 RepID=UPI002897B57C|nr:uncharacterized protein At2g33490-like isoform X2 [Cornus florida]
MKSSFGKLRKFALHKGDAKQKKEYQGSTIYDELVQASEDMQSMRNCYDSLLSAAAATANSAYEFSESLRDMGACLGEKTAFDDDEESGRVLSMLGKVQFELQKLVDSYRSHIISTITTPSESLLNELRTVEEMKRQCDEKRNVYKYMMAQQREKGWLKSGKGESFTQQQLQAARDEYDDEATLCVFRLKSLKQGQCHSLLTQAARHHAAQLNFFRKGLQYLEAVEPHIKLVTEKQHIDYQLSGLDDGEGGEDEGVNSYGTTDDGELSFDYRQNKQGLDAVSISRNSMELDQMDHSCTQASTVENAEINFDKNQAEQVFIREPRVGSYSAPIFPDKKFDPAERIREQPSTERKFHSYVLPTPVDSKSSIPSRTSSSAPRSRPQNLWHSSPLEPAKHDNLSASTISKPQSVLKESNNNNSSIQLPPPLAEGLLLPQCDTHNVYDTKKFKRQSFSGPLTSKPLSTKPVLSASGPITSTGLPQLVSGLPSRGSVPYPALSPKVSPTASPPPVSSPRINELHELPRPPCSLASKPTTSSGLIGHSAPLVFRNQELSPTNRNPSVALNVASPLPAPPLTVCRSFSIPSSNQRAIALNVAKPLEMPQISEKTEKVASPPLTPISLSNVKPLSIVSEVSSHSGQIRGGS